MEVTGSIPVPPTIPPISSLQAIYFNTRFIAIDGEALGRMHQYVVDELRKSEIDKITAYLSKYCEKSDLDNLFWLRIPDDLLNPVQCEHMECAPFWAGIEITEDAVVFEMLIRSRNKIRCNCISYATSLQRQFILNFADRLLKETETTA